MSAGWLAGTWERTCWRSEWIAAGAPNLAHGEAGWKEKNRGRPRSYLGSTVELGHDLGFLGALSMPKHCINYYNMDTWYGRLNA